MTIDQLIHDLASLLQVKLESEFDRNFEREGFFSEKWQRTRYGSNGHHTLIQSGALRRSIRSRLSGNEIEFVSDLPYSVIHNEGGRIRVTAKNHGRRPDYIIVDDLDDDQLVQNPDRVAKATEWVLTALLGTTEVGRGIESAYFVQNNGF